MPCILETCYKINESEQSWVGGCIFVPPETVRAVAGRGLLFLLAVGSIFRKDDKLDQLLLKRTKVSERHLIMKNRNETSDLSILVTDADIFQREM
jgi:hypothetical protein